MGATINKTFKTKANLLIFINNLFANIYFDADEKCFKDKEHDLYWNEKMNISYSKKGFKVITQFAK